MSWMVGKKAARADCDVVGRRSQLIFDLPDVRPLEQDRRRQAGRDPRRRDGGERAALHREALRRASDQHGERHDALQPQLLEDRNGGAHLLDEALLLRDVEVGGGAGGELLLDEVEDARRVGEVAARDAQAVLRLQDREVGVGDRSERGQRHHLLVEPARLRGFDRRLQGRLVLAPEIDDVARAQRGRVEPRIGRHPAGAAARAAGPGAELLRRLGGLIARVVVDERQQARPGDPHLGVGLQDLGDRDRDVEVRGSGLPA